MNLEGNKDLIYNHVFEVTRSNSTFMIPNISATTKERPSQVCGNVHGKNGLRRGTFRISGKKRGQTGYGVAFEGLRKGKKREKSFRNR